MSMPWKFAEPKPRKNSRNPYKEVDVKCNWCDERMIGKNYPKHCQRKEHEYLSFTVLNVGSLDFRARAQHQQQVINDEVMPIEPVIKPPKSSTPTVEEEKENTEGFVNVTSGKRERQPTLLDTSWGKMNRFEKVIEDLLKEVDNPEAHDYLERLQRTLKEIEKAAMEAREYRDKKRRKYEDVMRLEKTMMYLQEHNEKLEEAVRAKDAMLLVKEDEDQKRVIAQEDIERVQSHREQVVNTLRAFPCFDISDDGKHLECRCCEKNWKKARLNFSENRGKIKITDAIGGHAKRHVIGPKHSACRRAEDSFQIHREYYDEILANTEKRIASMTDNVIRVIYFIIKENIAMRKSEGMFDLLDLCTAAVGNQLHSRTTGAAIAQCIDETLQQKLIDWMFGQHEHSPDEMFVIADELTDVSGSKSCIVKTRSFEGLMLVEHLLTMVQSTGTSEDLAEKMQNKIIEDISKYTGLNREDAVTLWNMMFRGVGSDRA